MQKIFKQRRETNSIAPKVRLNQTSPKLKEEHRVILAKIVEANNDVALAELCEQLYARTGIRVGTTTMHNTLRKLDITVKKTFYSDLKANTRVQEARVYLWPKIKSILAQNLIFIDDLSFNLAMISLKLKVYLN